MRKSSHIRVGLLGIGASLAYSARGISLAQKMAAVSGLQLVAVCDCAQEKVDLAAREYKVTGYTNYDQFLEHEMDAVLLANYFHQHADYAVKALNAGKHVLSETTACFTGAEAVALVEAVERTSKTYMLAENYAYFAYNQEMRRLYQSGKMGDLRYGEGEYVHPMPSSFYNSISPGPDHWRNWLPMTYYCTHSLAPLLYITEFNPIRVNALIHPYDINDMEHFGKTARRNDLASVMLVTLENGSIVKLLWGQLRGLGAWVSLRCTRGLMENLRTGEPRMLRVKREPFDRLKGESLEEIYLPEFPAPFDRLGMDGYEGANLCMFHDFVRAIKTEKPPIFDVYRSVAMSLVGIQGYRSALASGSPMKIPDLRSKIERESMMNDHWSPDPAKHKKGQPWPSVLGNIKPSDSALENARTDWSKLRNDV